MLLAGVGEVLYHRLIQSRESEKKQLKKNARGAELEAAAAIGRRE